METKISEKRRNQIWKPLSPPKVSRKDRGKIWPIRTIGPNQW